MKFRMLVLASLVLASTAIFAQEGKVSSLVFFDYSFKTAENMPDQNSFGLHRAYLTYSKSVSDAISFKLQMDVGRQKDNVNNNLYAYLKNAMVKWKTDVGTLTFGLQGMNVFKVQEKTWGYRFIEKSAMDRNKFASSADLGVGFSRHLSEKGFVNAMVTNGAGYKKAETDKYKKYSVLMGYGEQRLDKKNGYNLGFVFSYEPYQSGDVFKKQLIGFLAGFAVNNIRVGAEFNILNNSAKDQADKLSSVYAIYKLDKKLQVFGRYDRSDDGTVSEDYVITGVVYIPAKALMVAPNVKIINNGSSEKSYNVNFQYNF